MDHSDVLLKLPNVAENFGQISEKLSAAMREKDRAQKDIKIIAISKKHGIDIIEKALEAGHRVFGENRVQEAQAKWPALMEKYHDVELHLVGPLQSNKVRDAVALFDVIHTVDRPKIAKAIANEGQTQGHNPALLVQVNTGNEQQKAGVAVEDVDAFLMRCRVEFGIPVTGLMCIPPASQPPAPHFAFLAKIAERNGLSELSMGMSGDYEIAAQLGSTMVRIGTGIFGKRPE